MCERIIIDLVTTTTTFIGLLNIIKSSGECLPLYMAPAYIASTHFYRKGMTHGCCCRGVGEMIYNMQHTQQTENIRKSEREREWRLYDSWSLSLVGWNSTCTTTMKKGKEMTPGVGMQFIAVVNPICAS